MRIKRLDLLEMGGERYWDQGEYVKWADIPPEIREVLEGEIKALIPSLWDPDDESQRELKIWYTPKEAGE